MKTIEYIWMDDARGWEVELQVSATVVPYVKADRESPASGGYLEDVKAEVTAFDLMIGEGRYPVPLTWSIGTALVAEWRKTWEGDPSELYRAFR